MKYLLCLLMFGYMFGCQTTQKFEASKQPIYELEELKPYNINTEGLKKPEKPSMVFLTKDFTKTDIAKSAYYVAFNQTEFKKIIKLSEICNTQLNVIHKQDELVNQYIFQINQLHLLLKQKNLRIEYLTENWENSENKYRKEASNHFKTKVVNNTIECILLIIILALAI